MVPKMKKCIDGRRFSAMTLRVSIEENGIENPSSLTRTTRFIPARGMQPQTTMNHHEDTQCVVGKCMRKTSARKRRDAAQRDGRADYRTAPTLAAAAAASMQNGGLAEEENWSVTRRGIFGVRNDDDDDAIAPER
mmetsp:Transcript_5219/g.15273  ORF Transcript_5219/g.15273 Transcript_5219/m.15273 type:complete len:135 (-) Transcript_5219:977-1381(-)